MRSKIHKAIVTQADLAYVGSITIDEDLLDAVGIWPGEKVLIVSNTTGARLETYAIAGARGERDFCVNGAASHLISEGEEIIIMAFELTEKPLRSRVILMSDHNRHWSRLDEVPMLTV